MDYKVIRAELDEAVRKIGEKYGFTGEFGTINYNALGFRCTLNAKVTSLPDGKSGAQAEYELYSTKFHYDPRSFGKTFTVEGKTFKITGVNPKARTMPILAVELATGKEYKFHVIIAGVYDFNKFPVKVITYGEKE